MNIEEIQVGEYVRTTQGYIAKIKSLSTNYMYCDSTILYYYEEENSLPLKKLDEYDISAEDYILKHSFNIKDLIEVGDYVNGKKVSKILKDEKGNITDVCYFEETEEQTYSLGDIKSIVTKEQMEDIQYEVE